MKRHCSFYGSLTAAGQWSTDIGVAEFQVLYAKSLHLNTYIYTAVSSGNTQKIHRWLFGKENQQMSRDICRIKSEFNPCAVHHNHQL